ncbi:MAG: chloride channel protein [Lachnospiraceae bacterium]|nr:chloride channel protein [Lachnospiraceae bacterium]
MKEKIKDRLPHTLRRLKSCAKWILFAIVSGVVIGGIGTIFYFCLAAVTQFRGEHPWILWLLPIGGVLIVGGYRLLRNETDTGTNQVIASIHSGENLPLRMAPSIFFSTLITHLCGGSAGREGAALQIGGSIGNTLGGLFRFDEKDRHVMTMCGMSAAFSALFGTPMAAAIFAMEVESVGIMYYAALVPCVIASLVAHGIAGYFGATGEAFLLIGLPDFTIGAAVKISILAILCGFVSILFCVLLHQASHLYKKFFVNPYIRILAGGCIVIALTFLVGDQRYNGAGMNLIEECMEGHVRPEMFLMKIIFTALTLGAGYKGGEIVPSFCIGGTFGCLFGTLAGFSPALCTGVGMAAVFCGVTNCPISSLLICFELFGYEGMPYFLLTIAFSYLFSGYFGLYSTQKIMYSKYKTRFIDRKAE